MNVKCEDRERIFADGTAEEWTALELHGATCAECAEELRAWKALKRCGGRVAELLREPGAVVAN